MNDPDHFCTSTADCSSFLTPPMNFRSLVGNINFSRYLNGFPPYAGAGGGTRAQPEPDDSLLEGTSRVVWSGFTLDGPSGGVYLGRLASSGLYAAIVSFEEQEYLVNGSDLEEELDKRSCCVDRRDDN
jgi:hypothetical protein